jgi:isoleucyl-tRNA synthetase
MEGARGEWDYDVPMLPGEHVTDDAGTGFVHTAPSHGEDDYHLGVKYGLPMTFNVLEDGTYRADLPLFGGQAILTPEGKEGPANVSVIKALHAAGGLFAKGRLRHSYPHSWRSKAPLIYRNTPQWFVAIDKPLDDGMGTYGDTIRQRALNSINHLVQWTPVTGRNRLSAMIEARPDWVLSRQRAWGVPLTCFVKKGAKPSDPDFLLRDAEVNRRIVAAFEAEGADVWYVQGFKEKSLPGCMTLRPMRRFSIFWMCGSTRARPMPSSCATGRTGRRTGSRTSTSKARTSTGGGSIPRCCRPAGPRGARPTGAC